MPSPHEDEPAFLRLAQDLDELIKSERNSPRRAASSDAPHVETARIDRRWLTRLLINRKRIVEDMRQTYAISSRTSAEAFRLLLTAALVDRHLGDDAEHYDAMRASDAVVDNEKAGSLAENLTDDEWHEAKMGALAMTGASLIDSPSHHLSYLRERIAGSRG